MLNISRAMMENHSRVRPPASMPSEGRKEGRDGGREGRRDGGREEGRQEIEKIIEGIQEANCGRGKARSREGGKEGRKKGEARTLLAVKRDLELPTHLVRRAERELLEGVVVNLRKRMDRMSSEEESPSPTLPPSLSPSLPPSLPLPRPLPPSRLLLTICRRTRSCKGCARRYLCFLNLLI
jgi:hypothetical protein